MRPGRGRRRWRPSVFWGLGWSWGLEVASWGLCCRRGRRGAGESHLASIE
jgi:hypothetical protein